MDTQFIYALLKDSTQQKATGAAFFILFTFTFIFFMLMKVMEREDSGQDGKIKKTLNLAYMSLTSILIAYTNNHVAATVFAFFLTFSVSATLILLFMSLTNDSVTGKYKVLKLASRVFLFLMFLTLFIVFNTTKK